eukprot:6084375-Pleurochrysis_carterae.AAC.3
MPKSPLAESSSDCCRSQRTVSMLPLRTAMCSSPEPVSSRARGQKREFNAAFRMSAAVSCAPMLKAEQKPWMPSSQRSQSRTWRCDGALGLNRLRRCSGGSSCACPCTEAQRTQKMRPQHLQWCLRVVSENFTLQCPQTFASTSCCQVQSILGARA